MLLSDGVGVAPPLHLRELELPERFEQELGWYWGVSLPQKI